MRCKSCNQIVPEKIGTTIHVTITGDRCSGRTAVALLIRSYLANLGYKIDISHMPSPFNSTMNPEFVLNNDVLISKERTIVIHDEV